ncbi:MAG TPA: DUF4126 domain-containing protein [Acidimicrobiia bacterium]|nr:DUF4126 domain-containing protein [Acidimicrobiia bacterium]
MIETLGLVAGSGWASGLNLYLVTLLLGLGGRMGWADVPTLLQRTDVLIVSGVLFVVEFAADKIPYLDNVWDAIHTVVRPLGAAALGAVLAGESESIATAVGATVAGALALSAHSAKATTRAAVNTSPEPFSNIFLSFFEDGLVAGLIALAVLYPWAALVVAIVLGVIGIWITTRLYKAIRRVWNRWGQRIDGKPPPAPG